MGEAGEIAMSRTVTVDVETSGLSAQRGGRVIEVGALSVMDGAVVAEFDTLIDSGTRIHYGAYQVHGISEEMFIWSTATGRCLGAHSGVCRCGTAGCAQCPV